MVNTSSDKGKYNRLFIGYESCSRKMDLSKKKRKEKKNGPFKVSAIWIVEINLILWQNSLTKTQYYTATIIHSKCREGGGKNDKVSVL